MLRFWVSLITGRQTKIAYKMYILCLSLFNKKLIECKWISYIKQIVDDCGMSFVFEEQLNLEKRWLYEAFLPQMKYTLKDQFLQKWEHSISEESEKYSKTTLVFCPKVCGCHFVSSELQIIGYLLNYFLGMFYTNLGHVESAHCVT